VNYIALLIEEHTEITTLIKETKELLPLIYDEHGQKLLLGQIAKLTDRLISHLIYEENILYPEFLKSSDIRIRAKADIFITELHDLKEIFSNFKEQFKSLDQISNNLDYTRQTIEKTLKAIENRVHNEETNLFVAAKKL